MITGFFPGRIRLRAPIFKDEDIAKRALSILQHPALSSIIKNIEHNLVTGSVLLKYHPTKVPITKLRPLLPVFQKLEKEAKNYSEKNKPVILAMLDELEEYVKRGEIG